MRHKRQYTTDGSLALSAKSDGRFTVYEGGLASKPAIRHASRRTPGSFAKELLCPCAIILLIFCVALVFDACRASRVNALIEHAPKEAVYASQGETVWGLAESHHVEGVSTAELVSWLRRSNDLESPCLQPGQELIVPSSQTQK